MDAHFHRNGFETYLALRGREVRFAGIHPWQVADAGMTAEGRTRAVEGVRARLVVDARLGVGEIGLDRLKSRTISEASRAVFAAQLALAAEFGRPVVLHGAKCWGEVVKACAPHRGRIPAFLFHGFSRSVGLLPEIFALNGFVSLGPALLNDHAVNYHALAKELPLDRMLVETDADWGAADPAAAPSARPAADARLTQDELLARLVAKLAALRGCAAVEIAEAVEANAARFAEALA